MNILGIETSCDETACALVRDGRFICSNVVASSLPDHQVYGGVIPEIASRRQLEFITAVVEEAVQKSGIQKADIDAVAVTQNPGLIGSLLVGTSFAKGLAYALNKPLILVDHIKAHLYASFLADDPSDLPAPPLPAVGLVISGGHTSLYHVRDWDHLCLLGKTRDDAIGEAFDKVARILDLGYPGGPVIDRLAKTVSGSAVTFKCASLPDSLDFSFSGIKTGVLYFHRAHGKEQNFDPAKVAYAFQESIVENVVQKTLDACRQTRCQSVIVGGGAAANTRLRARLSEEARMMDVTVFFPKFAFCMDNAAMVAGLGFHYFKNI